ncbi:LysR family transcriptional regulator [Kineosporia rhizophila]|uniref:LysR family transcriptional regulator n=1 Tax=Kineosporia TaxID=49184 RepID=UPI001E3FB901|nr:MULTISPECIES: LysR family transcriptional regulator [Kineosporia]MCE0535274.1 LysR family transcriptional regulator [Kineosporia rhizophila]GLY16946.1 LysR family transcriptional regulator [Kineosporia sp. NBRC 101677]
MSQILDIAPLRSFVAVADTGGFQRAATSLHLSQAAVSQHVRKLESATGRVLIERHGRGSRLTGDGERLLVQARRLLALHDETLRSFGRHSTESVVIGSTEHAAAQLLPYLSAQLATTLPDLRIRFRLDRGTKLREGLAEGRVDLALLLGPADDLRATPVGNLALTWYAAPTWQRPPGNAPIPVVAFDQPCALRSRALETLAENAIPAMVNAEAIQLAGVQAAVGAGLGVALMATLGQTPEGLAPRHDLPAPKPLPLAVWARRGLSPHTVAPAVDALRRLLARPALTPAPYPEYAPVEYAQGA